MTFAGGLCACHGYIGPPSSHFDGKVFFNPDAPEDHSFFDMVKWLWQMETVQWPAWIEDPPMPTPPRKVEGEGLRVTYINHATILIQMLGTNILTDPIWSKRAGPLAWLGPQRVRDPGIRFENLPKVDYVLISHNHHDHMDQPTLEKLARRDNPVVLAGLGLKRFLRGMGFAEVIELDWWESYKRTTGNSEIFFVPGKHNSGRGLFDSNKTLWGGFVIDSPWGAVYFAGDTAFESMFQQIAKRFTNLRLAILPIGSYEKRWFMKHQHMNPDDAVKAHKILKPSQSMGMHYATFREHPEQSIDAHEQDLASALKHHAIDRRRFWILGFGEGRDVPPISGRERFP